MYQDQINQTVKILFQYTNKFLESVQNLQFNIEMLQYSSEIKSTIFGLKLMMT